MCACEPGYVCSRCADTPADDWHLENEPEPPEVWFPESDAA